MTNYSKAEKKFLVGGCNTQENVNECNKSLLFSPGCLKRAVKKDRCMNNVAHKPKM